MVKFAAMRNSGTLIFFIFFVLKLTQDVVSNYLKEYIELTQEPYFVDKTPLIDALFRDYKYFSFISCPRLFGKTTNLKMIRSFAQMDFDVNGNPKMGENTTAFRIFRNSYVAIYRETFHQHVGRYMTIYLNLNLDHVKNFTDEMVLFVEMNKRLRECYEDYKWLMDLNKEYLVAGRKKNVKIAQHQITFMDKVYNQSIDHKQMEYALMQLVDLVYEFFEKDIMILIDDYDSGPQTALGIRENNGMYFIRSVREMILRAFRYTSGKTRPVKHAIMTSIGGVNHEHFFFIDPVTEERINMSYYPFLEQHKFAEYFGFSELQVDELLNKFQCSEAEKNEMKMYYRGYGSRYLHNYIYNPYSVVNYLKSKKNGLKGTELVKNYWADAVSKRFLTKFIRVPLFRQKLEELCQQNGSVEFDWDKYEISQDSSLLYSMIAYWLKYPEESIDELFKFFFQHGYLSHTNSERVFVFPNLEIKNDMRVFLEQNPAYFNESEEYLIEKQNSWWF